MSALYNRIAKLCDDRGITVTTMCKNAEVSRASLSDLKVGRKQGLSAGTLAKIASYFDVSVDYLLATPSIRAIELFAGCGGPASALEQISAKKEPIQEDERFIEDLRNMDFKDLINMPYSDERFCSLQRAFTQLSRGASDEQKAKIFEHLKFVIAQFLSSSNN